MGAPALAQITQHRGVDGHPLGHPGRAILECQSHSQQRIRAGTDPADRPAGATPAAEERLEYITETAEPGESATGTTGGQRIAAEIDDAPFFRIRQHLVGGADLLEQLLGLLVGVDVGVQFACQLAIGALNLGIACAPAHSEQPVVVACHAWTSFVTSCGAGVQPARLPRTSPIYIATAATLAIVPG